MQNPVYSSSSMLIKVREASLYCKIGGVYFSRGVLAQVVLVLLTLHPRHFFKFLDTRIWKKGKNPKQNKLTHTHTHTHTHTKQTHKNASFISREHKDFYKVKV